MLDGVGQVVVGVGDQLGEQRVAVGEVAVERGPGDAHPLADGVDRDAGDPVLGELFQRDALGLLPGLLAVTLPAVHVSLPSSLDTLTVTASN